LGEIAAPCCSSQGLERRSCSVQMLSVTVAIGSLQLCDFSGDSATSVGRHASVSADDTTLA
uniref:Uncharacterized protein n=1 Tax=Scophthalmus maximus TaxID=52904 RepID=A0A8D3AA48_SCOMX